MCRKPCSRRYRASVATCSTVNVTRKMGLSREKPQYRQMLMHSLLTYNGAKNRITRPKCFRVRLCDCRANASRYDLLRAGVALQLPLRGDALVAQPEALKLAQVLRANRLRSGLRNRHLRQSNIANLVQEPGIDAGEPRHLAHVHAALEGEADVTQPLRSRRDRSEERRVGKEGRTRRSPPH